MESDLNRLVKDTLEKKGVLRMMKAQLRKHVYDVIHEEEQESERPTEPVMLTKDEADQIVLDLVRDYLAFHKLDYTLSILKSEAGLENIPDKPNRSLLATKLRLGALRPTPTDPLLKKIVSRSICDDPLKPTNSLSDIKVLAEKKPSSFNAGWLQPGNRKDGHKKEAAGLLLASDQVPSGKTTLPSLRRPEPLGTSTLKESPKSMGGLNRLQKDVATIDGKLGSDIDSTLRELELDKSSESNTKEDEVEEDEDLSKFEEADDVEEDEDIDDSTEIGKFCDLVVSN